MRDPDTGNSKGYAFINFASFEASDAALEAMNGQHLCNRPISISYAFKKDSKGERHGGAAGTSEQRKMYDFVVICELSHIPRKTGKSTAQCAVRLPFFFRKMLGAQSKLVRTQKDGEDSN